VKWIVHIDGVIPMNQQVKFTILNGFAWFLVLYWAGAGSAPKILLLAMARHNAKLSTRAAV